MLSALDNLYVIGKTTGATGSTAIFIFNTDTSRWSSGPTAPSDLEALACSSVGDFIVVVGGYDGDLILPSNNTLLYNFKTNKWINKDDPKAPTGTGTKPDWTHYDDRISSAPKDVIGTIGGIVTAQSSPIVPYSAPAPADQYDVYSDPYVRASAPFSPPTAYTDASASFVPSTSYINPASSPYATAGSMSPYGALASPYADPSPAYVDPSPAYVTQGIHSTHAGHDFSGSDKKQPIRSPQVSPRGAKGEYAETQQGYGSESTAYPPPPLSPAPSPSAPRLYGGNPQQVQEEQSQRRPRNNNPQYIPPPLPPPRQPQVYPDSSISVSGSSRATAEDDVPISSRQQLAIVQARHEQNMERMRQEQQAELERMREQWKQQQQQQQSAGRS
ncbi:hypothetical protein BGX29_000211 [Mortierella sp. GBA35]|nr:hypothetical protein BGX29_000211 [Mortierella sp. GBA35]